MKFYGLVFLIVIFAVCHEAYCRGGRGSGSRGIFGRGGSRRRGSGHLSPSGSRPNERRTSGSTEYGWANSYARGINYDLSVFDRIEADLKMLGGGLKRQGHDNPWEYLQNEN